MGDKANNIDNELFEKLRNTTVLSTVNDTLYGLVKPTADNGCAIDTVQYECSPIRRATLKLIPNDIAKELHEAIAFGGESVKRSLALWYEDPDVLENMTSFVDMCVAYIGEEVTAVLRKHSTI